MTISPAQGIMGNDIISLSDLQIIGICGHAGAGKDTAAAYLQSQYVGVYGEAFADPLKRACAAAFGLPLDYFHDRELKEQETFWGVSPRKIAQFVGTEMFRELAWKLYPHQDPSHWIRMMEFRLVGQSAPPEGQDFYAPGDTVIITDCRFVDEIEWIWANGGIVLNIQRAGCEGNVGISGHPSEQLAGTALYTTCPERNYLINNNGTLKEFYETLDEFVNYCNHKGFTNFIRKPAEPETSNGLSVDDF